MYRRPPRRQPTGPRFDGARALDVLLRELRQSVPDFCTAHAIDRFHVERILRGEIKRSPSVSIVLKIENATAGRVASSMWGEDTLREDVPGDVPSVPVADAAADGADSENDAA